MHVRWLLLSLFLLIGCGQPLQINQPSAQAPAASSPAVPAAPTVEVEQPSATSIPSAPVTELPAAAPTQISAPLVGATESPVTLSPTSPSVVVVPRTAVPLDNLQRWRAHELSREAFAEPRTYRANQPTTLFWFDPANEQIVEIGTIIGAFPAQAQFTLRDTNQPALEVIYRINSDFGLTSISEALRARMRAANSGESVEAYVLVSEAVTIQQ